MLHIPYAGSAQAVPDLIGGRFDLLIGSPAAVDPVVRGGKGPKYLAVTSKTRFPGLPNVPSVSETLPGYDQPAAMGLMVTKGSPPAAIEKINRTLNKVLQEPDVKKVLIDVVGGIPVGGTSEAFGDLMRRQKAARGPLMTELGLIGKQQ
jgi:tripartite-type tricarboxylate transporter receptor subunit TctC